MPAVATPTIISVEGKISVTMSQKLFFIYDLISGQESRSRLSQYIGDFHPDAQVNGSSGLRMTAFFFSKKFAICFATLML